VKGTPIEKTVDPRRDVSLKLTVLARQMRILFDQHVGQLGVTRSQWTVIIVVSRIPGATQRVIAQALEMTEAAAGRAIDRLCADGLLVRQQREDDRRAYSVHLTDAAQPILAKLSEVGGQNEALAFAGFSDAELTLFGSLIDRLYDNVSGLVSKGPG
jgi:MarR family transcriptional regulator for hemolysin